VDAIGGARERRLESLDHVVLATDATLIESIPPLRNTPVRPRRESPEAQIELDRQGDANGAYEESSIPGWPPPRAHPQRFYR
jgi:hypothetical protein